MAILVDLSGSLLEAMSLVGLAMAFGGFVWALVVLPATSATVPTSAERRATQVIAVGAFALAASQGLALLLQALLVRRDLGADAIPRLFATPHFLAGMARALIALGLGLVALVPRAGIYSTTARPFAAALALLTVAIAPWLTHAASRLDHRPSLMALTALHQAAAAIWVGGLVQLGGLWHLGRHDPTADTVWPAALRRFSRVALVAFAGSAATGTFLAWGYEGSLSGLVGTGHGSLVLLKMMLVAAALVLAGFNRQAARGKAHGGLRTWVPSLLEGETLLLAMTLVTAAALATQPPGVDEPEARAGWREVVEVFRPKWPTLTTPSTEAVTRARARVVTPLGDGPRSLESYHWSNFNHNVSGLILLAIGLVALLGSATGTRWARHWPLGFVALGVFVSLREAMDDHTWPFGPLLRHRFDAEGLQHWIAFGLVLALGLLEWRTRVAARPRRFLPYLFPGLAAVGGALLLTHSHEAFELKPAFLVQLTHSTMGVFAALMATARWLELRLPPRPARAAAIAAHLALLAIALILVFYREANIVIPRGF